MKRKASVHRVNHPMSRCFESATTALASELLSQLSGVVPDNIRKSLRAGDFSSVVSSSVDSRQYDNAHEFSDAYMAVELMSKYPNWDLGIDKKAVALEKFMVSERQCSDTNARIRERRRYVNGAVSPYTPDAVISTAREKISRLLGPFNWDHAERYFGFGPGATTDLNHRLGDEYFKYKAKPWTMRSNAVLAYACISRIPMWFDHVVSLTGQSSEEVRALDVSSQIRLLFEITPGNRIITVPKNAKTERIIAIEPTMNGYVQHGIGGLIRSRLRRWGIDLNDQTLNQQMAREGSLHDSLSTIDLASASDSISMELVEELLPSDWVIALKQARSPEGVLPDGTVVPYQKVSSMGCGFTFELESLIFGALVKACFTVFNSVDRRFAVYGDDLIVPKTSAHHLIWILNYCGFDCNMKKTFLSGAFRESCGKHYFRGVDVTPIYIREDIDSPERAIWFANQVRRYSRLLWGLDRRFLSVYQKAVSLLPASLRKPSIPDGFGDHALFGDFDEVSPLRYPDWTGYRAVVNLRVAEMKQRGDLPYFLKAMSRIGQGSPSVEEVISDHASHRLRKRKLVLQKSSGVYVGELSKWRSVKINVAQWESFGPWI